MRPWTVFARLFFYRGLSASAFAWPLLALPGSAQAQALCEPPDARLVSIQGMVELKRAGTDVWTAAMLEQSFCIGDTLRVGAASRAALALANDSTLRVDQDTTAQLRRGAEEGRSLLDLLVGAIYFFSHRPRALEVDTPFVNAAAEGTEFLVRVGAERAEVVMLDGQVLLQNPQGELRIASGQAAAVPAGGAPAPMLVARPRDAVAWALYYPPILAELAGGGAPPLALPPGLQAATRRVAANDYAGALQALNTVPEAARDPRYYTYQAGVLLNIGRVDEAAAAIQRALALDPNAGEALAQRAIIQVVQNRKADALVGARRAVELRPDSGAARIALSYALQANFQLEEARATLREAVERNPEDALAWARLAELEQMFGELGRSRDAAERAVALAPELARTQIVLGFTALTRIDISEAQASFERAIALDSANPLPRLGLGLAQIRESNLEKGRENLEVAVALGSGDSLLRAYLGKAYFTEKRDSLASEQFGIAKELDPLDPTAYLYDAILKQTQNRPGEALQDVQRSIELNDNRAVYRSRLLLDSDRASRGTSLALIYDNLGFLQPGINEASKSLMLDPASAAAHRFLSDIYVGVRRREIARVSNLLQAQMLQDININPIQPSLSEANLNLVTQGGPARAGFNEFTPLFERRQTQLNASGVAGNNDTYGGEGVVSMLYDRYSLSAGAFGYTTQGWRSNNDIQQDIQDIYFQSAITPELNAQVEFRRLDVDTGDLEFDFDPDDFAPNFTRHVNSKTARAGFRYSPIPSSDFLLALIYSDREDTRHDRFDTDDNRVIQDKFALDDQGYQIEGQHLFRRNIINATTGFGFSDVDRNLDFDSNFTDTGESDANISSKQQITNPRGYVYSNLNFPNPVTWTAGLSYDHYDQSDLKVHQVNPKFGVKWNVTDDLVLRSAVFRVVKPALINNQTLEPTQVAGFNQLFDDSNAVSCWCYGIALDWRMLDGVFAGGEATWRELTDNFIDFSGEDSKFEDVDEQLHRVYIHWLPIPELALSVEFIYDKYSAEKGKDFTDFFGIPTNVVTYSAPFGVRYFHPSGWFAGVGATYVNQDVNRTNVGGGAEGTSDFFVVDASVGYRLPKRFGIVSLSVSNLFDERFKYLDDSFREFGDAPSVGPYFPERLILGRVTLNF